MCSHYHSKTASKVKPRFRGQSPLSTGQNKPQSFLVDPDEDRETQKGVGKGLERLPFLPWDGGEDGQLIVSPSLCGSIRFVP